MRIQMRNIMSTTDISDFSNNTLDFGEALCREYQARLYVCHVINLPAVATYYGGVNVDPVEEQHRLRTYVEEQIDRLIDIQGVSKRGRRQEDRKTFQALTQILIKPFAGI